MLNRPDRSILRRRTPAAAHILALAAVAITLLPSTAAAQEPSGAAAMPPAAAMPAATATPGAVREAAAASAGAAAPAGMAAPAATAGIAPTGVPPAGASSPAGSASPDTTDGVTAGMPAWKLLLTDVGGVFTAPARWTGGDWALFSLGVGAVVGAGAADRALNRDVLRGNNSFETNLANDFRPFGSYGAFGVLGAFYLSGLIAGDTRAQETAVDGLFASGIAGGVIAPALKEIVGRSRPSAHQGTYDFHPFSGAASFPSGETTEAFAAGSVIATEYCNPWVDALAYGTASLVGFARMRENAHWASDVVAGALIGTTVGRSVVLINRRLRTRVRVRVSPLLAPGAQGVGFEASF